MLIVGIDENGLGPLLGPLVVTGALFEAPGYDPEDFWRLTGPDLPAADSKQLFSRRRLGAAERATQAWLGLFGVRAGTHAALAEAVCLPPPGVLPCPTGVPLPPCVPDDGPLPRWSDGAPGACTLAAWDRLDRARVRPRRLASHVVCPGLFNARVAEPGLHKLRLDFALMLALVDALTGDADDEVLALCGKIGSTARYGPWLDAHVAAGWTTLTEGPALSAYQLDPRRRLAFVRDGDAAHLPVAVASMIGKYLRELAQARINAALGGDPARSASGYRDRVTAAFVDRSAPRRADIGLVDGCFFRRS